MKRGDLLARCKRVSHQVAVAAALWVLPHIVTLTPDQARFVRDSALGIAITALTAWMARTKGRRREELPKAEPFQRHPTREP